MSRNKTTRSEKIRRYIRENPDAKSGEVAKALGVKPILVYTVKHQAKRAGTPLPSVEKLDVSVARDSTAERLAEMIADWDKEDVKPADMVNHPPHYTAGGIETIDFIQAKLTKEEFIGYLKGTAIKYSSRIGKKDAAEMDAGKMAWYANKLREALTA